MKLCPKAKIILTLWLQSVAVSLEGIGTELVKNYFESTGEDAILNDAIRNEKKKLRLPVNNAHRQTMEMVGKIPGPGSQPPAETELRKWNGISVPAGWNAKSGIPWKVVRLFRKISGLTARSICGYTGRTENFAFLIAT